MKSNPQPKAPRTLPKELSLLVVNMDRVIHEGMVKSVIAPVSEKDNIAILPGHTPLFTKLSSGKLLLTTESGKKEIQISGGIAKVDQTKVIVLVNFNSD